MGPGSIPQVRRGVKTSFDDPGVLFIDSGEGSKQVLMIRALLFTGSDGCLPPGFGGGVLGIIHCFYPGGRHDEFPDGNGV